MGRLKLKKVDPSKQLENAQIRSQIMRKKTQNTKSINAHNDLLALIYNFLKQHRYDKTARKLRFEHNRLVGSPVEDEIFWENISPDYPPIISIFLQWKETCQIERNKAENISESSRSSAESDASSEDTSSEKSSLLTPSISSSSSEHDSTLNESEPESNSRKRKRISSSTFSGESTASTSSPSTSSSSEEDSDTSSQRPAKRQRRNGTAVKQDSKSSSSGINSVVSNQSMSPQQPTSESGDKDTSATESSSDSSQISDISECDAVISRSPSSDSSSSEQSSSEGDLNKEEVLSMLDSRSASPSAAVKARAENLNIEEKSKSTKTPKLKESSNQRRKNSTDSSNTLLGGDDDQLVDTKLAAEKTKIPPFPHAKKENGMTQPPHERQKANANVLGVKQLRKDNLPFSRIPKDIKVNEHFAANLYMPNAANEQMYQDLRSTKGKGFTKEKNKKKRGSRFSGGKIDIHAKETLKFDD